MARFPGRSRGCATCRRRHIKCDEQLPECGQCQRRKTKCPGAITDTFHVIYSVDQEAQLTSINQIISDPRERAIADNTRKSPSDCVDSAEVPRWYHNGGEMYDDCTPSPHVGTLQSSPNSSQNARSKFELPSSYQPSRSEIFDQLYFSHFFDTFSITVESIRACSWLTHLPRLMATTFNSKAMKLSSRATCMAWYGALTSTTSIKSKAREVYTAALASQLLEVYGENRTSSLPKPTEEAICTSIMLAYFEVVASRTSPAWEQHLVAAMSMLDMRGPENCKVRFIYQLYRTVRLGAAYMSLIKRRKNIFYQERWMKHTPDSLKTPLDILVDILLCTSHCMDIQDNVQAMSPGFERQKLEQDLTKDIISLIYGLDLYSATHLKITRDAHGCPVHNDHDDPLPGCLRAMQRATYLILTHLLHERCEPESQVCQHAFEMQKHSSKILAAVLSVDSCTQSHASRIFVTTVFPLEVVGIWSPSVAHRDWAKGYLQDYSFSQTYVS